MLNSTLISRMYLSKQSYFETLKNANNFSRYFELFVLNNNMSGKFNVSIDKMYSNWSYDCILTVLSKNDVILTESFHIPRNSTVFKSNYTCLLYKDFHINNYKLKMSQPADRWEIEYTLSPITIDLIPPNLYNSLLEKNDINSISIIF